MNIKFFAPNSVSLLSLIRNATRLKQKEVLNAIKMNMSKDIFEKKSFTYYVSDDGDAYPIVYHDSLNDFGKDWDYLIPVYHFCRNYIPKSTQPHYSIFALYEHNTILVYHKDVLIEYESEISKEELERKVKDEESTLIAKGATEINIFSDIKFNNIETTVISYFIPEGIKRFKSFEIAKKKNFFSSFISVFNNEKIKDLNYNKLLESSAKIIPMVSSVVLLSIVLYQQYQLSTFSENINNELVQITNKAKEETEKMVQEINKPLLEMKEISADIKKSIDESKAINAENFDRVKGIDKKVDIIIRNGYSEKDRDLQIKTKEIIDSIQKNGIGVDNSQINEKLDKIISGGLTNTGISKELEEKLNSLKDELSGLSSGGGQNESFKLSFKSGDSAVVMINNDKFRFTKGQKLNIGSKNYLFDFEKEVIIVEENGKSKTYPISK